MIEISIIKRNIAETALGHKHGRLTLYDTFRGLQYLNVCFGHFLKLPFALRRRVNFVYTIYEYSFFFS